MVVEVVVGFRVGGGGEGAVKVSSATTILSNEISHLKCQSYLRITPAPAQPIWPALPMEGAAHRGPPLSVQGGKNHSRPLSSTLSALLPFLRVAAVHKEGWGRRVSKNKLFCANDSARRFSVPLNEAPPYLKGSAVRVSSVRCGLSVRWSSQIGAVCMCVRLSLSFSLSLSHDARRVWFLQPQGGDRTPLFMFSLILISYWEYLFRLRLYNIYLCYRYK